jgi:hypothetical protein
MEFPIFLDAVDDRKFEDLIRDVARDERERRAFAVNGRDPEATTPRGDVSML